MRLPPKPRVAAGVKLAAGVKKNYKRKPEIIVSLSKEVYVPRLDVFDTEVYDVDVEEIMRQKRVLAENKEQDVWDSQINEKPSVSMMVSAIDRKSKTTLPSLINELMADPSLSGFENEKAYKSIASKILEKRTRIKTEKNIKRRASSKERTLERKIQRDTREDKIMESSSLEFKKKKVRSRPQKIPSLPVMEEKKDSFEPVEKPYDEKSKAELRRIHAEFRRIKNDLRHAKSAKRVVVSTQADFGEVNKLSSLLDTKIGSDRVKVVELLIEFVELIAVLLSTVPIWVKRSYLGVVLKKHGVRYIESFLISSVIARLPNPFSKTSAFNVTTQAKEKGHELSEMVDSAGDCLEYVFDSMFADSLKNVFITMAMMGQFPKDFAQQVFSKLGRLDRSLPMYDLLRICIKSSAKVIRVIEEIAQGVPLSDALFSKDRWITHTSMASLLLSTKDHLYIGLPIEGYKSVQWWLEESTTVIDYLTDRLKMTSQTKEKYVQISNMLLRLNETRTTVLETAGASFRAPPYGIIIGEKPGIGKSAVIDLIANEYCGVKGYTYKPALIFHRESTTDFMDGLTNQCIYHYSEGGGATQAIAKTERDTAIAELTSVMDSVAKMANMAQVDKKGKVWMRPELVIADTNNMSLNVQHFSCNPAAYYRRFTFAVFDVLPKFCKDGSCEIDFDKVNRAMELKEIVDQMDVYSITVFKKIARNIKDSKDIFLLEKGTIYQFRDLLRHEFTKHIEKENFIVTSKNNGTFFKLGDTPKDQIIDYSGVAKSEENKDSDETKEIDDAVVTVLDITSGDDSNLVNIVDNIEISTEGKEDELKSDFEYDSSSGSELEFDVNADANIEEDLSETLYSTTYVAGREHAFFSRKRSTRISTDYIKQYIQREYRLPTFIQDPFQPLFIEKIKVQSWDKEITAPVENPNLFPNRMYRTVATSVKTSCQYFWARIRTEADDVLNVIGVSYIELSRAIARRTNGGFTYGINGLFSLLWLWTWSWMSAVMLLWQCVAFYKAARGRYQQHRTRAVTYINTYSKRWFGIEYDVGNRAIQLLTIAAGVLSCYTVYKAFFAKEMKIKATSQGEVLDNIEEKIDAGESYRRINSSRIEEQWTNIRRIPNALPLCTENADVLHKTAKCNLRYIETSYTSNGIQKSAKGYAYGLKEDFMLMPAHYLHNADWTKDFLIRVCTMGSGGKVGRFVSVFLKPALYSKVSEDIVLFRTYGVSFKDITGHIAETHTPGVFESHFMEASPKTTFSVDRVCTVNLPSGDFAYDLNSFYWYSEKTTIGDCGQILVRKDPTGSVICGFHIGGDGNIGVSIPFTRSVLLKCMDDSKFAILTQAVSEPIVPVFVTDKLQKFDILEDPIVKSVFRHEHLENIDYLGKYPGVTLANQRSKLELSEFGKDVHFDRVFKDIFKSVPDDKCCEPMMRGKMVDGKWLSPINEGMKKLNGPSIALDPIIMSKCVNRFFKYTTDMLTSRKVKRDLKPLTARVAINGHIQDAYLRRMNASTAAGFGFPGKKNKYITITEDDELIRQMAPKLESLVEDVLQVFDTGEMVYFVYSASLKDEPRPMSKVSKGSTRLFYVSPISALIIARMFLAPLYTLMVEHCEAFCCAIGINMHRDGAKFFERLRDFSALGIEGDWGRFDTNIPTLVTIAAITYILKMMEWLGYNSSALQMLHTLLYSEMFPIVELLNDMFMAVGKQMSGKYGTAENNCIKCVFLLMYIWYSILASKDFFDYVLPGTYGDDVAAAVKPSMAINFNAKTIAFYAQTLLGMEFTAATKGVVTDETLPWNQMSFLKRTYRVHDYGTSVVCLESASIYKMLQWRLPSNFVVEEEQIRQTIDSCLRESFFHLDKITYDRWRDYLIEVHERKWSMGHPHTINLKSFPTYEYLVAYYFEDVTLESKEEVLSFEVGYSDDDHERTVFKVQSQAAFDLYPNREYGLYSPFYDEKHKLYTENYQELALEATKDLLNKERYALEIELKLSNDDYGDMTWNDIKRLPEIQENNSSHDHALYAFQLRQRLAAIDGTIRQINSALRLYHRKNFLVTSQADVSTVGTGVATTTVKEENITDVGGEETKYVDSGYSVSRSLSTNLEMSHFLERNVEIATITYPLSVSAFNELNVWNLFLSEPSVRAKIRNFAFLRGKMKLKIAVSASQFHYGTFLLAYVPQPKTHDISNFYRTAAAAYQDVRNKWMSQLNGNVLLRITDNKPIEMDIPYINYAPAIRIFNIDSVSAIAGAFQATDNLGSLYISTLNVPNAVNSTAPTSVNMTIYAHMEDVELGCPTSTQLVITTEANTDEHKSGPVEKISSTMADISGQLAVVPMFTPYALASQKVFSTISYIASLFGFSVPSLTPALHTPHLVRNDAYLNAVNTIGYCSGKKLTFDPRQELTIDPRDLGVDHDELALAAICRVSSLLSTFVWNTSSGSMSALLWQAMCNPTACEPGPVSLGTAFLQPTSMAFASRAFAYWRGTLKYKFYINKSQFHKGKLGILFEPNVAQKVIISSNIQLNKQHMLIVDIQETDEFELCIKFAFPRMWARVPGELESNRSIQNASHDPRLFAESSVGFLTVFPFTALQGPDTSQVQINVFVSSDDIQFNQFSVNALPKLRISTQADTSFTNPVSCFSLGDEGTDGTAKSLLHFGEQPVSFRQYLKRYNSLFTTTIAGASAVGSFQAIPDVIPAITPQFGGAAVTAANLLGYLRYAFLGHRGTMRKRLRFRGCTFLTCDRVHTAIVAPSTGLSGTALTSTGTTPVRTDEDGYGVFVPFLNPGIEIEIPMYTNNLYLPSGTANNTALAAITDVNLIKSLNYQYFALAELGSASNNLTLIEETAAGEDYTLMHYLAAPPYATTIV